MARTSLLSRVLKQLGDETSEDVVDPKWERASMIADPDKAYKKARIMYTAWRTFCGKNASGQLLDLPGVGTHQVLTLRQRRSGVDRLVKNKGK